MWQAASWARRSPKTLIGTRTFFSMKVNSVLLRLPASYIFMGAMRSPSAYTSVESEAFEPGTRPPTSVW